MPLLLLWETSVSSVPTCFFFFKKPRAITLLVSTQHGTANWYIQVHLVGFVLISCGMFHWSPNSSYKSMCQKTLWQSDSKASTSLTTKLKKISRQHMRHQLRLVNIRVSSYWHWWWRTDPCMSARSHWWHKSREEAGT